MMGDEMIRMSALAGLMAVLPGCVAPTKTWKGVVEWPEDESKVKTIVPLTEATATLAAAAAIREMVSTHKDPGLFQGCTSPAEGMDVAVFTGPTKGLYYVVLEQRFHRCGGPSGRVLDWQYVYAVTPQGEVVARAEPPAATEDAVSPPTEQAPAPAQSPPTETIPSPPSALTGNGDTVAPTAIRWPENLAPLAVLDGPAIVVANAAIRHVLAQKEYPEECEPSAESLKAAVGYQEPLYYVRVDARAERCTRVVPGVEPQPGWFRVYAFLPSGGMIAPNPPPP
jgi:hypothetical protein